MRLIKASADVEARNKDGCTPLYTAVKRRHIKGAQLLLEAGANPQAACNDGSTPLQQASDKDGWKQMESLLTRYSAPTH
jgi:ankyrin repeat protein